MIVHCHPMLNHLAALLMLVPGGIYTGIAVCIAVERVAVWDRLALEQYAVDFRRSVYRVDPLQPIMAVLSLIGTVLLAVDHGGPSRAIAIAAASLNVLIFIATVTIAEPINSQFRRRSEGEVPPDADALRKRWKRFHFCRVVGAIVMLVLFVLATFSF